MASETSQTEANKLTATPQGASSATPHHAESSGEQPAKKPRRNPFHALIVWFRDLLDGRMSGRYLLGFFLVCLCIIAMGLPSPYVVRFPGITQDVLGEVEDEDGNDTSVITISGADTYGSDGKLLMTTVTVFGASGTVTNFDVAWSYFDKNAVIMPREMVVPYDSTGDDYSKETDNQMKDAEDAAKQQAVNYVEEHHLVDGFDADNVEITINPGNVGGPSAGMMYTLGIIDELTPEDETGGTVIAGTGTMENDGTVGAIGGIRQKMIGAKDDGATWFLAPASNCDEVHDHVPDGLRDVAVTTLDEAYTSLVAIGQGRGDSLPHCSTEVYENATGEKDRYAS